MIGLMGLDSEDPSQPDCQMANSPYWVIGGPFGTAKPHIEGNACVLSSNGHENCRFVRHVFIDIGQTIMLQVRKTRTLKPYVHVGGWSAMTVGESTLLHVGCRHLD